MENENTQAQSTNSAEGTEGKAAEAAAATQAAPEAKTGNEASQGQPEKFELKLPEGSQLDQAWIEKIAASSKARGLSQEQAQAELNERSEMLSGFQQTQKEALAKQSNAWFEEVKTDKELGGDNLNKTVEVAQHAVNTFFGPKVKQFLDDSGFGNHPDLVRAFYKIGTQMRNDSLVHSGSAPGGKEKSIEDYFYTKT
jgi:hypothetical protein